MENRIEHIFLTYVNTPLTESPKAFSLVFEAAKPHLSFLEDQNEEISAIIEQISNVCSSGRIAAKQKLARTKAGTSQAAMRVAYLSAYGWEEKKCRRGVCYPLSDEPRQTYLKDYLVDKPGRRKCFECDQLLFTYMLRELVKGKPYSKICSNALMNLFLNAYSPLDKVIIAVTPPRTPFKEELRVRSEWNLERAFQIEEGYRDKRVSTGFNRSVMDLVGHSLAEFLLNNDPRNLRICEECKKFYVSKRMNKSRFCSDKCRLTFHNRKDIESGRRAALKRAKYGWSPRVKGKR